MLRGAALSAMIASALPLIVMFAAQSIVRVVAAAAVPVRGHTVLCVSPAPRSAFIPHSCMIADHIHIQEILPVSE